jgi:hypothetical protein
VGKSCKNKKRSGSILFGIVKGGLGHPEKRYKFKNEEIKPKKIEKLVGKNVVEVSCGSYHTICLTGNKNHKKKMKEKCSRGETENGED